MSHKPGDPESNDPEFLRQVNEQREIEKKDRESLPIPTKGVLMDLLTHIGLDEPRIKQAQENIDDRGIQAALAYIFRAINNKRPNNEIAILVENLKDYIDMLT